MTQTQVIGWCIILGLAMLLIALFNHLTPVVKTEFVYVEVHTDSYSPDDIGLVHLTQSDIEEML